MLYLYNFEVTYWDDDANRQSAAKGIVAGHTYSEALDTVIEYYAEENVISIRLSFVDDSDNGLLVQDIVPNPIKQPKQQLQEER